MSQLHTAFYNDPAGRAALNRLVLEVFGLDFNPWNDLGVDFEEYTPFAFFEGGRAVANVSASPMALTLDGQEATAVQIGTVCTLPELRRRGLVRELIDHAHRYWQDRSAFQYLFANQTVLDFYQQFGYRPVVQHRFYCRAPAFSGRRLPSRRLSLADSTDLAFLRRLADERAPVSLRCGVRRQAGLWLFHAAVAYPDQLLLIEELEVVVICQAKGACLHLIDVMGRDQPALADLYPYIGRPGIERVELHFTPDRMAIPDESLIAEPDPDSHLFIRGEVSLPSEPFRFPATSEA
jgi:GNAT superfamily N-acetyltransferase